MELALSMNFIPAFFWLSRLERDLTLFDRPYLRRSCFLLLSITVPAGRNTP